MHAVWHIHCCDTLGNNSRTAPNPLLWGCCCFAVPTLGVRGMPSSKWAASSSSHFLRASSTLAQASQAPRGVPRPAKNAPTTHWPAVCSACTVSTFRPFLLGDAPCITIQVLVPAPACQARSSKETSRLQAPCWPPAIARGTFLQGVCVSCVAFRCDSWRVKRPAQRSQQKREERRGEAPAVDRDQNFSVCRCRRRQ